MRTELAGLNHCALPPTLAGTLTVLKLILLDLQPIQDVIYFFLNELAFECQSTT